ncbi:hypothetical protein [Dyadobacter sp. CY323]|uniref:hypothetical protein n=1 Tax=Dyadobacter sp. CY323 TaxID=2907302 RepID=UPI001F26FD7B|nr:hypothetical protein [Dyadobacter sp. CY323]MCE6991393.1 hypothetical protein [Dyadobacter sp. CY323]
MKKFFFVLALTIGLGACKSDSEPEPEQIADITGELVGSYINSQKVNYDGYPIEFLIRWTISKIDNNHIRINQYAATNFVKPEGYQGPYDPDNPVESVIDQIEITEVDKFLIDRNIEYHYNGVTQKANILIDAKLVGANLDVYSKEIADGNKKEEQFLMKREWKGIGRLEK